MEGLKGIIHGVIGLGFILEVLVSRRYEDCRLNFSFFLIGLGGWAPYDNILLLIS